MDMYTKIVDLIKENPEPHDAAEEIINMLQAEGILNEDDFDDERPIQGEI